MGFVVGNFGTDMLDFDTILGLKKHHFFFFSYEEKV